MRRIILSVADARDRRRCSRAPAPSEAATRPSSAGSRHRLPPPCGDEEAATPLRRRLRRRRAGRRNRADRARDRGRRRRDGAGRERARRLAGAGSAPAELPVPRGGLPVHGLGLEPPGAEPRRPRRRTAPTTTSRFPALTANKTMPRPDQAWRIRALGPRFHAMAEAHLTGMADLGDHQRTDLDGGRTGVPSAHGCCGL